MQNMKHQFPPNLDEDNPLFKTDGFRMFCFKVLPCSKRYCHDWTTCPFSHPAEKAKRRDPRIHTYTGVACPECKRNMPCPRGDACTFAHNVFEYWLHPSRYRTQLCNDGINCNRKICFFAHTLEELRVSSVKVMPPDSAAKLGSPTSDAFDPFCLPEDGHKPHQMSTSPVSPLSCMDQSDPFNSAGSSRRSSMQLHKPRMSMDHSSAAGRFSLDNTCGRPQQQQQLLHQRNSIDMAELQLQHLQLAAMKAQLQMQQTAALQSLAAQQQQQQQAAAPSMEQLAQMITQMQLANSLASGDQLMPAAALQALLPQQLLMPNLTQVLMQQVLMQQQQQHKPMPGPQNLHEQLLQQLQLSGLPADMGAGLLSPGHHASVTRAPAGSSQGQHPELPSVDFRP